MTILCNLQNINLVFGEKALFKNAGLTINKGDQIGLIGLNGHGKSTLFKILTNQVKPDHSNPPFLFDQSKEHFSVFLVPQELPIKEFSDLEVKNFYLAFYPDLYKLHQKISDISHKIAQGDHSDKTLNTQQKLLHDFEVKHGWQIQNSFESYLKLFGLSDTETPLMQLSGGEQKKLALSAGLSAREELILWDEPTNHLDIESIEELEDQLQMSNKTFIVISHDRYLLNHVSNKIFHIDNGEINQFQGNYLQYLEYQEEKEKERLKQLDKLQNKHRRELAWMRQGIKARGTRSKKRVEGFNNLQSEISNLKGSAKRFLQIDLQHSGRKTKKLIELKEAEFGYDKTLLTELNLGVFKKDKIAIIGPNGSGKTTLINLLAGNLQPTKGSRIAAQDLSVVIFDQKRLILDENKTPKQVVGDGKDHVITADGTQKHIHSYLENYLFQDHQINRPISTLSGGEKNRLQLAMFMLNQADLWIFDEPTNDLDIETIELLEQQLKDYKQAVLIIGHDRAFLDNVVDQTWLVNDTKVEVFTGGYTQVAPYLHALELEKQIAKQSSKQLTMQSTKQSELSSIATSELKNDLENASSKVKMTNKEKLRWKVIEDEIANTEQELELAQVNLANFDFTNINENTNKEYEKLGQSVHQIEALLEKLYEEWEELSLKKGP